MKIALGVEYDGTNFRGWQTQTGQRSVQACLEQALSRVADHPVKVFCAGRTDAGVHAYGQVVHFESEAPRSINNWLMGANTGLPGDIRIHWAQIVSADFHARFSAISRRYHYVIYNAKSHPAILRHYVSWEQRPLNVDRMCDAAQYLLGEHDFSAFRARECQSHSPCRNIRELNIHQDESLIIINIKANAFLQHMVRNIAGVLLDIGAGKRPPLWAKEVLEARQREKAGVTAKATGLYLAEVEYPESFSLPGSISQLKWYKL